MKITSSPLAASEMIGVVQSSRERRPPPQSTYRLKGPLTSASSYDETRQQQHIRPHRADDVCRAPVVLVRLVKPKLTRDSVFPRRFRRGGGRIRQPLQPHAAETFRQLRRPRFHPEEHQVPPASQPLLQHDALCG